ncbi:MAG TPA: PAS domain-containing protein, partial [Saprospiraceae bacterium]|nr:PAS domain-containing protein [Saprospiraceae bacterium]
MGSDVTQERKTRRELEESQEYLKFATESAEVGIWSLALPSEVLTWSDFHKQMWGYDYHASLHYEDWHRVIHTEDVQDAIRQVENALKTRTMYQAEYRIRRADTGEERWMRSVGQYFFDPETDQPYRLTGVTYDITARKTAEVELLKSQQRLAMVLDSLPDGFMIFDAVRNERREIVDFEWPSSNAASTLIVGRPPEELIGKRLLVEMPGNKEAGLFDAYVKVVESGEPWANEFAYPYEGINKHFVSRAVKVGDGFGVMFSDITLRKEFEAQLTRKVEERTQELQVKNQQLEQYAFVTSHDLQEPLRKIEMFADMLTARSRAHLPDTGKHHLDKIVNAAGRMRALIDALLKFSRMSTQINEEKPVNLNTIVSGALNMLEVRIHEKRAQFEVSDLPTVIGTDSLLDILFSNLIANSLKFSKDDTPPQVRIHSRRLQPQEVQECRLDTQRHYTLISIEDNGLGFEQEFGERIFEMFRRLHKDIQGTGIGLAMCAKIVQLHGGSIKAFGTPE